MSETRQEIEARTLAQIGERSGALRKELRLRDLVLMQILIVMGISWVGTSARQGPTHVAIWALAILTFYLPAAAVIVFLSRQMPVEGGLYQWVKIGLGPLAGFLAAWNLWVDLVISCATVGLSVATNLSYALGPQAAWMAGSKWLITALNVAMFAAILYINVRGFRVARWATGAGAAVMIAVYAVLIGLLIARGVRGQAPAHPPFSLAAPALTLMSANLFSKIAFCALGGFEHLPVFAGECRDAGRIVARSTWIAAPLIALLYILGAGALLCYTPPEKIDRIGPIPQVLAAGLGDAGPLALLGPLAILALTFVLLTQTVALVAEAARMPMVAGWDGLLPAWFTRLHPRYATPARALLVLAGSCVALGLVALLGVGEQEALQVMLTTALACAGVYYLLLFAVVLAGARRLAARPSLPLRAAALSGAAVTLLSIGFQLFPIIDVASPWVFGAKVGAAVILANLLGVGIYLHRFLWHMDWHTLEKMKVTDLRAMAKEKAALEGVSGMSKEHLVEQLAKVLGIHSAAQSKPRERTARRGAGWTGSTGAGKRLAQIDLPVGPGVALQYAEDLVAAPAVEVWRLPALFFVPERIGKGDAEPHTRT